MRIHRQRLPSGSSAIHHRLGTPIGAGRRRRGGINPIRYYLHTYTDDEWQLGQLIDRINTLGTLRLAATMEIGRLKAVGSLVETLAFEIEDATEFIMVALKKMKDEESDPDDGKAAILKAENKMLDAGKTYQRINDVVSGELLSTDWNGRNLISRGLRSSPRIAREKNRRISALHQFRNKTNEQHIRLYPISEDADGQY